MQFHPLAYIVKLNIEMSMASLIAKIAKSTGGSSDHGLGSSYGKTHTNRGTRHDGTTVDDGENGRRGKFWATVTTTVEMTSLKSQNPQDPKQKLGLNNDTDELIERQDASYNAHIYSSGTPSMSQTGSHTIDSSRGSDGGENPREDL
jgi:hypothetical protein